MQPRTGLTDLLTLAAAGDRDALGRAYELVYAELRRLAHRREWRTHFKISAAAGSHGRLLYGAAQRAQLFLIYRGNTARPVAVLDSALQKFPLGKVLPGDRPYDDLARFEAAAGRVVRARELLAGADSNDRVLDRKLDADRSWTRGVIALAAGQPAPALAELRRAANEHRCEMCPLPALARAQEATGDVRGAIESYERYLVTPWYWRYEPDGIELSRVLRRLADLRAANGDSVGAANARARLAALWRKADPELRSTLGDAK